MGLNHFCDEMPEQRPIDTITGDTLLKAIALAQQPNLGAAMFKTEETA
mgnify:CR=1 FL=1